MHKNTFPRLSFSSKKPRFSFPFISISTTFFFFFTYQQLSSKFLNSQMGYLLLGIARFAFVRKREYLSLVLADQFLLDTMEVVIKSSTHSIFVDIVPLFIFSIILKFSLYVCEENGMDKL